MQNLKDRKRGKRGVWRVCNSKSGKRFNDKTKLTKARQELKKVMVENESLRLEILNARSQNFKVKMQLARTKHQLRKQKTYYKFIIKRSIDTRVIV